MNYWIQISGDVKGPFPIEKLVEEGLTKRTKICINGTEVWDYAEDLRELDDIWEENKEVFTEDIEIIDEDIPDELKVDTDEDIPVELKIDTDEESSTVVNLEGFSNNSKKIFLLVGSSIIILLFIVNRDWKKAKERIHVKNVSPLTLTSVSVEQNRLNNLLIEGVDFANRGVYKDAFAKFSDAKQLLISVKNIDKSKADSLAAVFDKKAQDLCKLYKNSASLNDIPNEYFIYVALLKQTNAKKCN